MCTSIWRVLFPSFQPSATVENLGVKTVEDIVPGMEDDRELERRMEEFFDKPHK